MSIRDVIPTPTPVSFGGRPYLASEYRLSDLAKLQGWLDAQIPSPYEAAAPLLESSARPDWWKHLLSEVIDAQGGWPKEPGDPEAEALLRSAPGRKLSIALALGREHPGLGPTEVDAIYDAATVDEYARLMRVAWGADPIRAMAALVDGPSDHDGSGGPDWVAAWDRYNREYRRGPAFEDLTITQWRAFQCGGELPDASSTCKGRTDWAEVAERRRKFWGPGPDSPG